MSETVDTSLSEGQSSAERDFALKVRWPDEIDEISSHRKDSLDDHGFLLHWFQNRMQDKYLGEFFARGLQASFRFDDANSVFSCQIFTEDCEQLTDIRIPTDGLTDAEAETILRHRLTEWFLKYPRLEQRRTNLRIRLRHLFANASPK